MRGDWRVSIGGVRLFGKAFCSLVGLDLLIADELKVEVEVKKYESDLRYVFGATSHSIERTHHFVDALRSQSMLHISVLSLLVCPPF